MVGEASVPGLKGEGQDQGPILAGDLAFRLIQDPDRLVVLSNPGQNAPGVLDEVEEMAYQDGEIGLEELTPEAGCSQEDVLQGGVPALVLWQKRNGNDPGGDDVEG